MVSLKYNISIASRRSPLALKQANMVIESLRQNFQESELIISLIEKQTLGDKLTVSDFTQYGGKAVFTDELDQALINGGIDMAVHSVKDMPTVLADGVELAATLPRGDIREAFISKNNCNIHDLPPNACVGTISMRRASQVRRLVPEVKIVSLRGNVATRMNKVYNGEIDGTVLALAGIQRLGLENKACQILDIDQMLPAIGQAAVGVTVKKDRLDLIELLQKINHQPTRIAIRAERAFLRALGGNCRMPIAGFAFQENDKLHLTCEISDQLGDEVVHYSASDKLNNATALGIHVAKILLQRASAELKNQILDDSHQIV